VNLTSLVKPGSVQSALLTGVLGIQPRPTVVEILGWLGYFVPVSLFVLQTARRKPTPRADRPVATAV
jgi:high-affinity iron transporter